LISKSFPGLNDKLMKILFVNKFFFLSGGSERVFFQERDFLIANGHSVIDFSMKDSRNFPSPYSSYFIPNITFRDSTDFLNKSKAALSFIHSSSATKNLEKLITREKPAIAHLHNIYHQLTPSIIPILKKHGVKVVVTLHDYKLVCPSYLAIRHAAICNDCHGEFFWKPFTTNCQGSLIQGMLLTAEALWHKWKGSYDGVDLFLSPSNFMAALTTKRINSDKIRVLHNGINVDEYQPKFDDNGYVIYFGRISSEKGIETLLKANSLSGKQLPLKIIGTGPLLIELEKKYPEVEFLGYCSGQQLRALVANAAFVVVPSEWYENCSMVILESMALGKPIIASRTGGIPEQIEDGKTGFLFEMRNVAELAKKMDILGTDKELRASMGQEARHKLEKEYSLADHCQQLVSIYQELLT